MCSRVFGTIATDLTTIECGSGWRQACSLAGRLTGWLTDWLTGLLTGWLAKIRLKWPSVQVIVGISAVTKAGAPTKASKPRVFDTLITVLVD